MFTEFTKNGQFLNLCLNTFILNFHYCEVYQITYKKSFKLQTGQFLCSNKKSLQILKIELFINIKKIKCIDSKEKEKCF